MIPKESQGKKHKDSKILFIYLFLTALCLSCSERVSLVAASGLSLVAVRGPSLVAVSGPSLVAVNGFLWLP